MNQAHYHLALNHLPIIIPMLGLLILIGGFIFRSEIVKRTAFVIFLLGAVVTIPAFTTGEGAEEVVEELQDMSGRFIHNHEEVAETFALLSYVLGGISILALWMNWKKKSFAPLLANFVLLFSTIVLYFAMKTGTTGGEIRHTEIRSESIPTNANDVEQE